MSTTHTPGPWREGPTEGIGQVGRLRVVDANGVQIADCEAPKRPDNALVFMRPEREDTANAHLIAAAPDLLAALKALVEFNGQPARIGFTPGPAGEQDYHEAWTRYRAALTAIAKAEDR